MRTIRPEERRARLGIRHNLCAFAPDVGRAAADAVGLHSSDPASVYLAAWARTDGFVPSDLEDALYRDRSLARMLGMRRTMFVVPLDQAAIMHNACTIALAPQERGRLIRLLEDAGHAADAATWLDAVEARVMAALAARGEATAIELTEDVPELGLKLTFGEGKRWGGKVGVSTRVLFLMATDGRIVRGRPRGSWISSQYRWAATSSWLGADLPHLEPGQARRDLARRWLRAYGPGTPTDLKWWTGWGVRQTQKTLGEIEAVEVELDGGTGYLLGDDLDPAVDVGDDVGDWVALLPCLDPTVMGWKDRSWYLGEHQGPLFDRNGNAGPTVWANGRVVGGWAQRADGDVAFRLLEDVGAETAGAIEAEAARLATWLGDVRITPRFRTPLEKHLVD